MDGSIVAFGTLGAPAPPTELWLRPFSGLPKVRCLVCLSESVVTEHHTSVVSGMCKEERDAILLMTDTPEAVADETTQHLCRGCASCHFIWSERIAGPEDRAAQRRLDSGTSDE
ncbi:hypothetical protein [Streptomyces sp. NPDC018055]|uniref:hypothetical protein n=1 Tax=Streptomyces sp. NPDC018055 TaxID=3365038 RepID=UPI003796C300